MLVGKTERHDVPGEPGEWFEFRYLSGAELDEAADAATKAALKVVSSVDLNVIQQLSGRDAGQRPPESQYDKAVLLKYGLVAWSYPEPCTDENKARLDAKTRDWAVRTIVAMNTLGE